MSKNKSEIPEEKKLMAYVNIVPSWDMLSKCCCTLCQQLEFFNFFGVLGLKSHSLDLTGKAEIEI